MVKPLDVYLGEELAPSRQMAIDAVRASGCDDDNSHEFWDRVTRIEDVCSRYDISPITAASALEIIIPFLWPDGEYGLTMVPDSQINPMINAIARRLK